MMRIRAAFGIIPCKFPINREFNVETRSVRTGSRTKQSDKVTHFRLRAPCACTMAQFRGLWPLRNPERGRETPDPRVMWRAIRLKSLS